MAAKISKTTADKLAYSQSVLAATEVSGEDIAKKASKVLFGDGPASVDLPKLMRSFGSLLQHAHVRFEEADAAHLDELADDDPLREEREVLRREVIDAILRARSTVEGTYGSAFAASVGLLAPVEKRPDLVEKQAAAVARLLRRAKKPKESFAGAKVDLGQVADELEGKVERLRDVLASLKREEREAERTLIARDQADEYWNGIVSLTGAFGERLAEIAGEHAIAARFRPTDRRRAGILDPDVTDAVDTDATDTDASDTDPSDTDPSDTDVGGDGGES